MQYIIHQITSEDSAEKPWHPLAGAGIMKSAGMTIDFRIQVLLPHEPEIHDAVESLEETCTCAMS